MLRIQTLFEASRVDVFIGSGAEVWVGTMLREALSARVRLLCSPMGRTKSSPLYMLQKQYKSGDNSTFKLVQLDFMAIHFSYLLKQ